MLIADLKETHLYEVLKQENIYHIKPYLFYPGYIDTDDMPMLYNAAFAFLYPSLRESFGIPVLEAMTASKGSAMREFYLSRARILYVRRNLKGINKYLSLFYHILLAAPKKSISYFINGEVKLSAIVIWGTLKGLFKRNIY